MGLSSQATTAGAVPPWIKASVYRGDIDGLRAIAVLSVLFFHAFPQWMRGGFIGVDIFFVISGYLISGIIFKGLEHGTFSFRQFYEHRVIRIFPALIVEGDLCVGINTAGRAPAVSSALRQYLSKLIPPKIGALIDRVHAIRLSEPVGKPRQEKIIQICRDFFKL